MWNFIKHIFGVQNKKETVDETAINTTVNTSINTSFGVVPPELVSTISLSQLARHPSGRIAKEEILTIDKVYNEKKPNNPTKNYQLKRIGKIYTVLSNERKKDIMRLVDPVSFNTNQTPEERKKQLYFRLIQLRNRLNNIEKEQKEREAKESTK